MRVVIVGGSFAGLRLARLLEPYKDIEVLLIEPRDYWEYSPGMLHVLCGSGYDKELVRPLGRGDTALPSRVRHIRAVCSGWDTASRQVFYVPTGSDDDDESDENDGSKGKNEKAHKGGSSSEGKDDKGNDKSAKNGNGSDSKEDKNNNKSAKKGGASDSKDDKSDDKPIVKKSKPKPVRQMLQYDILVMCTGLPYSNPVKAGMVYSLAERLKQLMCLQTALLGPNYYCLDASYSTHTVVIYGGGLIGVELAAELAYRHRLKARATPSHTRVSIVLISRSPCLHTLPPAAGAAATKWLTARGVEIILDTISHITETSKESSNCGSVYYDIVTSSGRSITANLFMNCTGMPVQGQTETDQNNDVAITVLSNGKADDSSPSDDVNKNPINRYRHFLVNEYFQVKQQL
jgi:NADH dehydrogenase FAD-containing subunit